MEQNAHGAVVLDYCWLKTFTLDLPEGQCCSHNVELLRFYLDTTEIKWCIAK